MCRQRFAQSELLRVRRTTEGIPTIHHGIGRSAYVCKQPDCVRQLPERGRVARAWRGQVSSEEFTRIRALLDRTASASLPDG